MRLKTSDIANLFNISKQTVFNLMARGKIPQGIRIGHCYRWSEEDITEFTKGVKENDF